MGYFGKTRVQIGADPQAGRIRGDEIGIVFFQKDEAVKQPIVLQVRYRGPAFGIVLMLVPGKKLPQTPKFFFGFVMGHVLKLSQGGEKIHPFSRRKIANTSFTRAFLPFVSSFFLCDLSVLRGIFVLP
jgi:hypothetical protein